MSTIDQYISEFWSFYQSPISNEIKFSWLAYAENPYAFYRAFVPLFYKILDDSTNQYIQNLRSLKQHTGWVVGDPHPANFGAILIDKTPIKQSIIYSVNDPDDGYGDSPMYIDLLRFLTGVRIIGNSPVKKILKAYLHGLNGKALTKQPREVKICLKQIRQKERRLKKRDYIQSFNDLKKRASTDIENLSTQKLTALQTLLIEQWQDFELKIIQGFEYIRTKGGSGGLSRKVLLVKFSNRKHPSRISHSKWMIVEFKQIRKPSSQHLSELTTNQLKEAQKQSHKWQSLNKPSKLYWFVNSREFTNCHQSVADQVWFVRPRWVENPVIDPLTVLRKKQRIQLYLYQAKVLGNLHRIKALNRKTYHDDIKQIKAKQWKKAAKYAADKLNKLWQNKDQISVD